MIDREINFNAKRFLILLTLICVLFFIAVIKAFDYLPKNDEKQNAAKSGQMIVDRSVIALQSKDEVNTDKTENKTAETENKKKDSFNVSLKSDMDVPEIEEIDVPPQLAQNTEPIVNKNYTKEEIIENSFKNAEKYKENKDYVNALSEYQQIISATDDSKTVAKCYEEIATIYGIIKKYGTGLAYAQKAYNLYPSSQRELLLARFYYKTGDVVKATQRINNILQRDFALDR